MTVSSEVSSVSYNGNGSTQIFAVPFYFLDDSHLRVILRAADGTETVQTITTNYTVSGAGNQDGGSVTMLAAPASGVTLAIVRNVPATQETDYVANDPFPAESHERALDKLTMLIQQAGFDISRAIRVPDSDPEPSLLPSSIDRANLLLSFDSLGNPTAVAPSSGSATDLAINLANDTDPTKGAALVGYDGGTLYKAAQGIGLINSLDATGTTDCTAAIQAALTARDVVTLPAGDFKISSTIQFKSGNVLQGQGYGATRIFRDTGVTPFDFFAGISVSDVQVHGIHFDSVQKEVVTVASSRHSALRFWDNSTDVSCQNLRITGCRFSKFTSAEVQTEGARGVVTIEQCLNVEIDSNYFDDNRATCILWWNDTTSTDNVRVHDNYCLGEQTPYDPYGRIGSFVSGRASGVSVHNNRIDDTGYSSINASGNEIAITGNVIKNPGYSGIGISEVFNSSDVTICENVVVSPGLDGISIWNVDRFSAVGNSIYNASGSSRAGVALMLASGGEYPRNGVISGNNLVNCTGGVRVRAGQSILITGNRLANNSTGIAVVNTAAAASDCYAIGNTFIDNTSFAISLDGSATNTQTVTADGNVVYSSDIATLQATGFVVNGSVSTLILGRNTFSPNYTTSAVETVYANRATDALLAISGGTISRMKTIQEVPYIGTATYDPASIAAAAGVTTTVTVTGAAVGDMVQVSFSNALQGITLTGWVSATNTVSVRFQNGTTAAIDLASGTITAQVVKL